MESDIIDRVFLDDNDQKSVRLINKEVNQLQPDVKVHVIREVTDRLADLLPDHPLLGLGTDGSGALQSSSDNVQPAPDTAMDISSASVDISHASVDISHASVDISPASSLASSPVTTPSHVDESNLECSKPIHDEKMPATENLEFTILTGGSTRGADLLICGGRSYTRDNRITKRGGQRWRCSVRNKKTKCRASVMQIGDKLHQGVHPHICTPKGCAIKKANIRAYCTTQGKKRPLTSGSALVKEALQRFVPPDSSAMTSIPTVASLIRTTNRNRGKKTASRPDQPKDLKFTWVEKKLPDNFLQYDISFRTARHIIMFTTEQLQLLSKAKTWYVDGTFKAVQRPFQQLWSIHTFICEGSSMKQVPLVYVLMSRRSREEYFQVIDCIKGCLTDINVNRVVMDFDPAVWRAFHQSLPEVELTGCCYHWTQALWRKIEDLGLAPAYYKNKSTSKFLRQLLCLHFLPAEQIPFTFQEYRDLVEPNSPAAMHRLMEYIEDTWIEDHTWTPSSWSVFGLAIRTNSDVEGWHNPLNKLCNKHKNVNVYELIKVLHKESLLINAQCQHVSEEKLQIYQRQTFKDYQQNIFDIWQEYTEQKITPRGLLQRVSEHHQPYEVPTEDNMETN